MNTEFKDMDKAFREILKSIEKNIKPVVKCNTCGACPCRCQEIEKEKKRKAARYQELLMESRIDLFFINNDFKVHSPELLPYNNIEWLGKESLLIYGNPGCHKTGQITAIAKIVMQAGYSVRYYRATELRYNREDVRNKSMVIIDNTGKAECEDKKNELFDLIDYRIHNYRSTVLITNENLSSHIAGAFYDRLKLFKHIKISGESQRGAK